MSSPTLIILGDNRWTLQRIPTHSIDAVVCDPPYGLGKEPDMVEVLRHWLAGDDYEASGGGFMGKTWDSFVPGPATWREVNRVLKPGGHLLAFAGSRTFDMMGLAIRLAGFEIRDGLSWLYGSGFPKSMDVSKAIDKAAGAEREVVGEYRMPADSTAPGYQPSQGLGYGSGSEVSVGRPITAPATPAAVTWQGWGTALKPAWEPVIVARKPLIGTVAANVLEWGTGAVNVDVCRIGVTDAAYARNHSGDRGHAGTRTTEEEGATDLHAGGGSASDLGRWPANVVLDEVAAGMLDEMTGDMKAAGKASGPTLTGASTSVARGQFNGVDDTPFYGDSGGASRFYYVAKPSKAERSAGLPPGGNVHPTVKPVALMRWLVRLVTPPGGIVLDPFLGSGTTGIAAVEEGFGFVGLERSQDYVAIAHARLTHHADELDRAVTVLDYATAPEPVSA